MLCARANPTVAAAPPPAATGPHSQLAISHALGANLHTCRCTRRCAGTAAGHVQRVIAAQQLAGQAAGHGEGLAAEA